MRLPSASPLVHPLAARVLRAATCAAGAALAACASSTGGAAVPEQGMASQRTVIGAPSAGQPDLEIFKDRRGSRVPIAAPPTVVWNALPAAFASVGLEGLPVAGSPRTLAAQPRVRRVLSKVPLSRYLDCGRMPTGEMSADNHLVRLTVTSAVVPEGTGSAVSTQVTATAAAVDNSNSPVDCSSTGVLETRITETLAALAK